MCHIKSTDESLHNERRRREFCNDFFCTFNVTHKRAGVFYRYYNTYI